MNHMRHIYALHTALSLLLFACQAFSGHARGTVAVDSLTGNPVPKASVFDKKGNLIGVCSDNGLLPPVPASAYPLTISSMGYAPASVGSLSLDTVVLRGTEYELPEVLVESKKHQVLHMIGYVREYSTLTTYSDTVMLFREKTVDFMVPVGREKRCRGWTRPRVLASRSFYRFSNSEGLDSVSGHFGGYFSWADWIDISGGSEMPETLKGQERAEATAGGRHGPAAVWRRNGDDISLEIDILADERNARWAPGLYGFVKNGLDIRRMNLKYLFSGVGSDTILADDIACMSFSIESNGRGRNLNLFFRTSDPVYVDTYAEIYMTDKEYISVPEAKRWEKALPRNGGIGFFPPPDAPELQPAIRSIVERVEAIDYSALRLNEKPDSRYAGKNLDKTQKRGLLNRLKSVLHL